MKFVLILFAVTSVFYELYSLKLDKFIIRIDDNLVDIIENPTHYNKHYLFRGVRTYLLAFKKVLLLFKLGRNKVMKIAKQIYEEELPLFLPQLSREMQNITANFSMNSTECKLLETILKNINSEILDFKLQCQINPKFVGECSFFDHVQLEITENRVLNILKRPRKNHASELILYANKYYALLYDLTRKIKSGEYNYLKVEYLYNARIPTLLKRKINFNKLQGRVTFEEGDINFFEELMKNISMRWTEFMDVYAFKALQTVTTKKVVRYSRKIQFKRGRRFSDEVIPQDEYTLTKPDFINIYIKNKMPTRKLYLQYESIDWYDEFLNLTTGVPTTQTCRYPTTRRKFGWFIFKD